MFAFRSDFHAVGLTIITSISLHVLLIRIARLFEAFETVCPQPNTNNYSKLAISG